MRHGQTDTAIATQDQQPTQGRQKVIEELLAIDRNGKNLEELVKQLCTVQGVIPFVGAGMSAPLGFPLWDEFLRQEAKRVESESARTDLLDKIDAGKFEDAARQLAVALHTEGFHDSISATFGKSIDRVKAEASAVWMVPQLLWVQCAQWGAWGRASTSGGFVVTTNVDHALEQVFDWQRATFTDTIFGPSKDMLEKAIADRMHLLFKLHGSAEEPSLCVFSGEEYDQQYEETILLPLSETLAMLYSRPLLFLGCSLKADRTMEVLRKEARRGATPWHFAIVSKPDAPVDFDRRRRYLTARRIRPIWYLPSKDRNEQIEALLRHIVKAAEEMLIRQLALHGRNPNPPPVLDEDLLPRKKLRRQVLNALASGARVVAIAGLPGIGKTTLAAQIANAVAVGASADQEGAGKLAWFESVIWVSAASKPDKKVWFNDILNAVGDALQAPGVRALRQRDEKTSAVRTLLDGRRILIVVDNFDTMDDVALEQWLASIPPRNQVLITSQVPPTRNPLAASTHKIEVERLSEAESVTLIKQEAGRLGIAGRVRPEHRLPLAHATQGHPTVIKWTLGRIAAGDVSAPDAERDLKECGRDTQTMLVRLFERHWNSMSDDACQVLLVVPLFAGSATNEALRAAAGLAQEAFGDARRALVNRGLIAPLPESGAGGKARFTQDPVTRSFAAARLRGEPEFERQARRRLGQYYVGSAREIVVGKQAADGDEGSTDIYWRVLTKRDYEEADREWPNLLSVLNWAITPADGEDGGERDRVLVDLMLLLTHYMNRRMRHDERLTFAHKAAEAAARLHRKDAEAWLRVDALGWILLGHGRLQEAEQEITAGLQIARELGPASSDSADISALAHAFLADVHRRNGDLKAADDSARAAAQFTCRPLIAARVCMMHGLVAKARRAWNTAIEQFRSAADLANREGDIDFEATARENLANVYLELPDAESAEAEFDHVRRTYAQTDTIQAISALFGLARVSRMKNDEQTACARAGEARDKLRQYPVGSYQLIRELDEFLEVCGTGS